MAFENPRLYNDGTSTNPSSIGEQIGRAHV